MRNTLTCQRAAIVVLVTYAFAAHAQQYNEYYYEYSSWYTAADNLALRKPVTQSSQLYSIGAASNAVDGIHDGRFWDGACSHTKNFASGNSWLDVDLGSNTTDVKVVVVSLRTDCCQDRYESLEVRVGNNAVFDNGDQNLLCEKDNKESDGYYRAVFRCINMTGQHVTVRLGTVNVALSVCEVMVFDVDKKQETVLAPHLLENDACPPPLAGACNKYKEEGLGAPDAAVKAFMEGPIDCGGNGFFCRMKQDPSGLGGGFTGTPGDQLPTNRNYGYCVDRDVDRQIDFNQLYRQPRNNDGHCHGSELDTSYIGVLEDHYYRPYRGTITCCCGLDKRDEDGEWAPAKNFISRCDYRGKENNDANENFERGCGTDMFAFMDKEEFPNKDNTCWTLDNFGKPYKGQEVMDRPPYNQPKARSTFCQDDGSDYEGCTLVLESGSAIRALLMMSTYPLEDARMIDDIKGCDEVHGVRISEKGLELRSYHQLKAVPTDIEGMPVTFSVTYQGCYVDNGQRAFASRAGYLSMEECAMKALESGNSKFAMQWPQGGSDYTAECYMDDKGLLSDSPTATYRKVSDTECKGENWNPTFLSQVFEFNGNGWRNAVYYIEAIGQDGQVTELSFDYKLLGDLPAGEQLHMQVLDTWTCSMSDVITLDLPASSR